MAKKKVLSLWKALMLVFTGLIAIAGGTALVLYLMGEFERDVVEPDHMEFSQEVSGEALYDGNTTIAGVSGQVSVFKTSGDFQMTIVSNTEEVTEKTVSLSLKNQISSRNGVLSDGVVLVPEKVYLNTPFSVKLVKGANVELSGTGVESWVLGGNSVITAKSTNILLEPIVMQIQVDVPVYDIELAVSGKDFGEEIQTVYLDLPFTIDTKFTPSESEHLFFNSSTSKKVFFSETKGYIHYDWQYEKFMADKKSGGDYDTIKFYVFANSYYEKSVLSKFSSTLSKEDLNTAILNYANEKDKSGKLIHEHEFKTKEIKIKVTDVAVESIHLGANQSQISPYINKYFTLTTNSSINGDDSLEAVIRDSDQVVVESALANIGIRFASTLPAGVSKDAFVSDFSMTGGDVIRVIKLPEGGVSITRETFDAENVGKYYETSISIGSNNYEVSYYLLPNTRPSKYEDYYWQFACKQVYADAVELDINFFFENEQGQLEAFYFVGGFETAEATGKLEEGVIKVKPAEHDYEEDPAWVNTTIIMNINFDSEGNAISASQDLSKDLNPINQDNVYKSVKYFLFIDDQLPDGDRADIDPVEYFDLKSAGKDYDKDYLGQQLSIPGTKERTSYKLYELANGSVLTAKKSFAGMVSVVVATIKTDADGNAIVDADGKYTIIKTSYVRNVKVESSLSIQNLVGEFAIDTRFAPMSEYADNYFVPAVNRDDTGSQEVVITFNLALNNSEDAEVDRQKVESAFNTGALKVVCLDIAGGELLNQYLTLESLVYKDGLGAEKQIVFQGNFIIEESFFTRSIVDSLDQGTYIALQLQYNDGRMLHTKKVENIEDGKKDYFYIYSQQPKDLEWVEKDETFYVDEDFDKGLEEISVDITSTETKMNWGTSSVATLEDLNKKLSFKIKDQRGREIDSKAGTYKVQFVEIPVDGEVQKYLAFNGAGSQINGFNSTAGQEKKTTMRAYIVDAEGQYAFTYDANGNVQMGEEGIADDEDFYNKSELFEFAIKSEGVAVVLYEKTTDIKASPEFADYQVSENNGSVAVSKYILPDSKISMSNLLKIYLDEDLYDTDIGATNYNNALGELKFYLDPTFVTGLSSERAEDLTRMLKFNAGAAGAAATSLSDLLDTEISEIEFVTSFKVDTELKFIVKDKNESLFEIELTLVCKSDLRIGNAFNTYYDKYADYLVQRDSTIGVFADESYSLKTYLTLTSTSTSDDSLYSWAGALSGFASLDDFIVVSNVAGGSSLCSLESNGLVGADADILLKIAPVYTITTINIKIYYGTISDYACSASFSLCLNPNIVVEETVGSLAENPYINLSETLTNEMDLFNRYHFFKFTGTTGYYEYLEKTHNRANLTELTFADPALEKFAYTNNSTIATADMVAVCDDTYISIDTSGKILFVKNEDDSAKTISLDLGDTVSQRFAMKYVSGEGVSQKESLLQAIKIRYVSLSEFEIVLTPEDTVYLYYDLGYGQDDLTSSVIKRDDSGVLVEVKTVEYNSETYAVLLTGSKYKTQNDFEFSDEYEGLFGERTGTTELSTQSTMNTLMSYSGNNFKVFKNLDFDGTSINIEIAMQAIISGFGENFVYYQSFDIVGEDKIYLDDDTNATNPGLEGGKFNTYADVEFQDLIGNIANGETAYRSLEINNIYQTLEAGAEYNFVTSYETNSSSVYPTNYGFYYSKTFINPGANEEYRLTLSIVSEADGYVDGLAEIVDNTKLKINHLSDAYDETYIVLRFEIAKFENENNKFVYFYRVKVEPSFTVGSVKYPYADDAEYLDWTSKEYYSYNETEGKYFYEIDLEDVLSQENSKYSSGRRFEDISMLLDVNDDGTVNADDMPTDLTKTYYISKVLVGGKEIASSEYNDYFTYQKAANGESLDGSVLKVNLKNENTNLTIVVTRRLFADTNCQDFMIGSEQSYTFKFNQGDVYEVTIVQKEKDKAATTTLIDTNHNNIYKSTVYAGNSEISYTVTINKTESGVAMPVNTLGASIVGSDLQDGLMAKQVAFAGTKYYADASFTSEVGTLSQDMILGEWQENSDPAGLNNQSFTHLSNTYYIKGTDTRWCYAYVQNKVLYLKPQTTISKDISYEIVFYTDQKPSFYIELSVEGYFTKTQNLTEVTGGEVYTIVKDLDGTLNTTHSAIFSEISSDTTTVTGFDIRLKTPSAKVAEFAGVSGIESDLEYSQLVKPGVNEISFAQLKVDVKFDFIATITDANGSYEFEFSLLAKKSFEDRSRTYRNTVYQYSGKMFTADLIGGTEFGNAFVDRNNTSYKFADLLTTKEITPDNVTASETVTKEMEIVCLFDGEKMFSFNIDYVYTVLKNVNIETNYPRPDGATESEAEYIEAKPVAVGTGYKTDEISNFFTSQALYNTLPRIELSSAVPGVDIADIDKDWTIAVSSISNTTLHTAGKNISNIGETIYTGSDPSTLALSFSLANDSVVGEVVFAITVNKVPTTYKVVIVPGSVYSIATYAPNYANNHETIYAEDYALQEAELFKEGRILHYRFAATTVMNSEYYVRLRSGTEIQAIKIVADSVSMDINQDLNVSYKGYVYEGTFQDENSAKNNTLQNKLNDADLFDEAPIVTNRLEVYYYDGTKVKFESGTFEVRLKNGGTIYGLGGFTLTNADYIKEKTLDVLLVIDGTPIITKNKYSIYFDIKFDVEGGVKSANDYTVIELQANPNAPTRLLSLSQLNANAVKLVNPITGEIYTEDSLYASHGQISLQIYGFDDLAITNSGDNLQKVAFDIHKKLIETTEANGVKYETGLTPRAGTNIPVTGGSCGTSADGVKKNYVSITGLKYKETGKIVDYNIFAQGANNDGNHIMMRLTYAISVGTNKIEKSFNIMFKVLPNSAVLFRTKLSEPGTTATGVEYVGTQSVASNYEAPLQIEGNGHPTTFYIFRDDAATVTDVEQTPIMQALMYGQGTDASNDFTTFTNVVHAGSYDSVTSISMVGGKLIVVAPAVSIGEKNYLIELTNSFGYKARLYFRSFSNINPQIVSGALTMTEGENFAFGSQYQVVAQEQSFTFNNEKEPGSSQVAKKIRLSASGFTGTAKLSLIVNLAGVKSMAGTGTGATIEDDCIMAVYTNGGTTTETVPVSISGGTGEFEIKRFSASMPAADKEVESNRVWRSARLSTGNFVFPTAEQLAGATYTLAITFDGTAPSSLTTAIYYEDPASVALNGTNVLGQNYSITPTPDTPDVGASNKFIFAGIPAYAFDVDGAINTQLAGFVDGSLVSKITNTTITSVKFYVGNSATGLSAGQPTAGARQVVTSEIYKFVESVSVNASGSVTGITTEAGKSYIPEGTGAKDPKQFNFIVPYFNGIDFGAGDIISDVRMVVTLNVGGQTCDMVRTISIKRKTSSEKVFENNTIADGSKPVPVAAASIPTEADRDSVVYNDTLEVKLDAGADISIVVEDSAIGSATVSGLIDSAGADKSTENVVSLYDNNIIRLTNDNPYAITKYVSITQNIKGLSSLSTNFLVYAVKHKEGNYSIKYNGSNLTLTSEKITLDNILLEAEGYVSGIKAVTAMTSAPVLHINHINELSASNQKQEELYFLIKGKTSLQLYQHKEMFIVNTEFTKAQHATNADNYFEVADYYKVSNANESYYIATADKWASNINLENSEAGTTGTFAVADIYKYQFEVDTKLGGSAVIDENGMITTARDFDVASHTIFVNMYMKVSGADGNYANGNSKIRLAQFRLFFKQNAAMSGSVSAGVYVLATNSIIVVPTGFTLAKTAGATAVSTKAYDSALLDSTDSYAFEVGTTITKTDLDKIYASKLPSSAVIKDYHIVQVAGQYLHYDNVNTYTFTTAGNFEVVVTIVYRNAGSVSTWRTNSYKTSVVVYDTAIVEDLQVKVAAGSTYTFDSDYLWFKISSGKVEPITTYSNTSADVYDEQYIAKSKTGSTTKVVNATFFVYDSTVAPTVALRPLTNYNLSGLVDSQLSGTQHIENMTIYKVNKDELGNVLSITAQLTDMFNNIENATAEAEYVVVGDYYANDDPATTPSKYVKLYSVKFDMVPLSVTEIGMVVEQGANVISEVRNKIASELVGATGLEIYETDVNGVEKAVTSISTTLPIEQKTYLVKATYASGVKFHRFEIDFYSYEMTATTTYSTSANYLFNLSNLNGKVEEVFDTTVWPGSGYDIDSEVAITYGKFNEDTDTMDNVSQISLESSCNLTYFVKVGITDGTNKKEIYLQISFNVTVS